MAIPAIATFTGWAKNNHTQWPFHTALIPILHIYMHICMHKLCPLSDTDNMIQNTFDMHINSSRERESARESERERERWKSRDTSLVAALFILKRVCINHPSCPFLPTFSFLQDSTWTRDTCIFIIWDDIFDILPAKIYIDKTFACALYPNLSKTTFVIIDITHF